MPLVSLDLKPEDTYMGDGCNNAPCIYLTEEQCAALGFTKPPDAGTVIGLTARCVVTRATGAVNGPDDSADKPDVMLTLCMTDAEITAPPMSVNAANVLYGGNND